MNPQNAYLHHTDPLLGQTINGYVFRGVISCGGAAQIYAVTKNNAVFAAKVSLDGDDQPQIELVKESFKTEFEILKSLNHKNIIQVYEHFEYAGRQIIIMEYFRGCNLDQFIEGTSISTRQRHMKTISKQLLKAVKYLHQNQIIHRDIKPGNILIGRNFDLKIIDFGGALKLDSAQVVEDRSPRYVTPDYMPPEVLSRDVRSYCDAWLAAFDMWSVGVTLYETLLHTLPFNINSGMHVDRKAFFSGPDVSVLQRVDKKIGALIKKCLDIQPSTRITAKQALKSRYFKWFSLF